MLPEQQQRILGYFIEEAKDHLNTIEQGLLTLQATINDRELLKEVYRAAHSVKGGAGMLSLQSIQKTSHLLEDCFKLLEESPVQVDQKLESMFWQVFDALKELLEQLQGPFGLTEDVSNSVMASLELVSGELRQHLQKLVSSSAGKVSPTKAKDSQQELLIATFKQEVMEQLRQMLQLFKPPAWPNSRPQLEGCCDTLAQMGNKFELSAWCGLMETAKGAIANQENTCQTLAPIVIKEIKAAQELVLTGKAGQICVGEQLQALLPVTLPAQEEELDFGDLFSEESVVGSEADIDFAAISDEEEVDVDLFAEPLDFSEPEPLTNTANLGSSGKATRSIADHTPRMDAPETQRNPRVADRHGPEVGAAELNTLADLFQEAVDLDDNWQEEESFSDTTVEPVGLESPTDLETDSEFADLFDSIPAEEQATDEDLLGFLSDDFEEEDLADLGLDDDIFGEKTSVETEDNLTELFADLPKESETWDEITEVPEANLKAGISQFDGAETEDLKDLFAEETTETKNSWNEEDFAPLEEAENLNSDNSLEFLGLENQADFNWEDETAEATTAEYSQPEAEFDLANLFDEDEELLDFAGETSTTSETEVTEAALTDDFGFFDDANELLTSEVVEDESGADTFDFGTSNDELWSEATPEASATTEELNENWFANDLSANEDNQGIPVAIDDLSFDAFDPFALDTSVSNQQSDDRFAWDVPATADSTGTLDDLFASETEDLGNFAAENLDFGNDLFGEEVFAESTNLASTANVSPVDEFTTYIQEFDTEFGAYQAEEPGMEWLTDNSTEASLELFESDAPPAEENFDLGNFDRELAADSELAIDDFPAEISDDGFDWGAELTEATPKTSEATVWQDFAELPTDESFDFDGLTAEETEDFAELPTDESFDFDGLTAQETEDFAELPTDESFDFDGLTAQETEDFAELPTDDAFDFDGLTAQETEDFAELPTDDAFDFDGLTAEETEEFADSDGLETNALSLDTGSLDSFDNFDLVPGELEAEDGVGDWDFAANVGETDEFGDLAALLNEEEAPALDRSPDADFADLEAMLGDEELASAAAPNNHVDTTDDLDFADLEAMLGDESPSIAKTAIPAAAATAAVAALASQKLDDDIDFSDLESLVAEIDKKPGSPAANKPRPTQSTTPKRLSRGILEQTMKVPVKQMDNLSNLVGELVVNRNTLEQEQERLRQFLDNLLTQVQQLSDVGARMQDLYERSLLEASLLASRRRDHYHTSSFRSYGDRDSDDSSNNENSNHNDRSVEYDPLDLDQFTPFHTISQEMIELIVRVRESTADIEFVTDETEQVSRQFRQVTTQLQEGLTRARMVPFGEIERVFPLIRYVRDKAAEFGKQAEIKIEGRETLIDKLILEHFSDPLKHLVNNAIAHGIETPEIRQKAGKPAMGRITIKAFHQGNQTVISFSDDGAGINADRVKTKAIEKRLISRTDAENMTRQELYQLIYHPGFSTKDEADLLSGKGVGMDVVLTSLSEIRGTITTDSNQGKGTSFTIRLPLTLSICKALCCLSDKARIAFPMDGVEDALDIPKDRIKINAEGKPCIPWRDTTLPFKPLSELLTYNRQLGRAGVYGGTKEEDVISIVVLRSPNNLIALQIDQVLGEQEIVIKQLEGPIPKPLGIAGATVQGDGRIMPIADVLELVDLSLGLIRNEGGKFWDQDAASATPEQPKSDPTVLIVDDSITVRELLSMTFNKTGYRVEQARDGQEAWDKLKSGLPCDIIFCDIEMPRMDGLELLSRLQKDPELSHLPVAMLTSRGADKHRQMAVQLGASGYFTKPYLEDSLLDAASRMLKGEKLVTSNASA
ncbi:response regulator [Phormidium sp. LEGE 05292]|uniref:hybrid sensor histidine kinase/response regulator n=1 Tax=[Phormidium] sp. LEGE 05292 TaxID=767427 RepID=UPI0018829F2B|nr:response regulator [Phormidium sp. LEGE 05292]MBE9227963.1 response regulator [Phormidium sp. LEGE 05292]